MILEMTNEKWQKLLCYKGFYDFVKDVVEAKYVKTKVHLFTIKQVMKFPNFAEYSALIEGMEDEQDWAELKAILYSILAIRSFSKKYLPLKTSVDIQTNLIDLFSCNKLNKLTTKKIKDKEIEINELENVDLWEFITSEYKGKQSLQDVSGTKPDGTEIKLSDYEWEFNIIFKVVTVPPYPSFNNVKLQLAGSDNDNRTLRAEVVSDYIKEHPANDELKIVLTKFALVDTLYHGQLEKKVNYEEMAKLITGKPFKTRDGKDIGPIEMDMNDFGKKSLSDIADIVDILRFRSVGLELDSDDIGTRQGELSPVTKYIHCHEPNYPIWDRNVNNILSVWHKYYGTISGFSHETSELKYYEAYKNYIDSVRDYFNSIKPDDDVKDLTPDEFDSALWILGGKYK